MLFLMEEILLKNIRYQITTILTYLFFDLSICFSAFTPFPKPTDTLGPSLRIRVEKNLPKFSVSGMDLKRTLHLSQNKALFGGQKKIVFNCKKALNSSRQLGRKTLLASIESPTGFISLMRDRYQGNISSPLGRRENSSLRFSGSQRCTCAESGCLASVHFKSAPRSSGVMSIMGRLFHR